MLAHVFCINNQIEHDYVMVSSTRCGQYTINRHRHWVAIQSIDNLASSCGPSCRYPIPILVHYQFINAMPSFSFSRYLPFSASTTTLQGVTYLLGISLFSISFLVFLNSSVSFVVTDLIGQKKNVGDVVGTLGFVDEIVALIACPVWGLISDRLGVRWVAMIGYAIISIALALFVQARNVYPQLILARIFFAVGASAA